MELQGEMPAAVLTSRPNNGQGTATAGATMIALNHQEKPRNTNGPAKWAGPSMTSKEVLAGMVREPQAWEQCQFRGRLDLAGRVRRSTFPAYPSGEDFLEMLPVLPAGGLESFLFRLCLDCSKEMATNEDIPSFHCHTSTWRVGREAPR